MTTNDKTNTLEPEWAGGAGLGDCFSAQATALSDSRPSRTGQRPELGQTPC